MRFLRCAGHRGRNLRPPLWIVGEGDCGKFFELSSLPKARAKSLVTHDDRCAMVLFDFAHFMLGAVPIVPLDRQDAPFTQQLLLFCNFRAWGGRCCCGHIRAGDVCICCDRKAHAASAQSFTLWQQAIIEITLVVRATCRWVLFFAHITWNIFKHLGCFALQEVVEEDGFDQTFTGERLSGLSVKLGFTLVVCNLWSCSFHLTDIFHIFALC